MGLFLSLFPLCDSLSEPHTRAHNNEPRVEPDRLLFPCFLGICVSNANHKIITMIADSVRAASSRPARSSDAASGWVDASAEADERDVLLEIGSAAVYGDDFYTDNGERSISARPLARGILQIQEYKMTLTPGHGEHDGGAHRTCVVYGSLLSCGPHDEVVLPIIAGFRVADRHFVLDVEGSIFHIVLEVDKGGDAERRLEDIVTHYTSVKGMAWGVCALYSMRLYVHCCNGASR